MLLNNSQKEIKRKNKIYLLIELNKKYHLHQKEVNCFTIKKNYNIKHNGSGLDFSRLKLRKIRTEAFKQSMSRQQVDIQQSFVHSVG